MHGCFLYMHTPICYYLSLQLAILLNYKLLKISIIRTKMWSLKLASMISNVVQNSQQTVSVFFYKFLTAAADPAFPFQNPHIT